MDSTNLKPRHLNRTVAGLFKPEVLLHINTVFVSSQSCRHSQVRTAESEFKAVVLDTHRTAACLSKPEVIIRRSEQLRERDQTCSPRLVPRRWPRRPCRSHPALQSAEREVNRKNVRNNKHEVNSNFRMFVQLNSYKLRHNAKTLECLHNSITIQNAYTTQQL